MWRSSGTAPHHPGVAIGENRPYPQFLHHRSHRSRQVHPGGQATGSDRHARQPSDAGTGAGLERTGTRARHHHKAPRRAHVVPGEGRPGAAVQPDRHPRPRRLHLRGVALAGGVRGSDPGCGRHAGSPGADPVQPLPRPGCRPRDRAGPQQDRPAGRGTGAPAPGSCRADGNRPRPGAGRFGKGGVGHRGRAGSHRRARACARRRPGCPPEGADLRFVLRPVPRGRSHHPGLRRHVAARHVHHVRSRRLVLRGDGGGPPVPRPDPVAVGRTGRGRVSGGGDQGRGRHPRGRHGA